MSVIDDSLDILLLIHLGVSGLLYLGVVNDIHVYLSTRGFL